MAMSPAAVCMSTRRGGIALVNPDGDPLITQDIDRNGTN